ncbi:hypothetical protein ABEB36_003874 [Hypothenemus hampei]|uniref:Cyclin A n=1 Tax=Hypothenemus hampei TaxID=57062 RepID=A0ABD1F1D7_HYPHA
MATIRIHQDQENERPQLKNKMPSQANGGNNKRAVLGVLNNDQLENNIQAFKNKQPMGQSKLHVNHQQNKENWGNILKENTRKNIVNPIIPVAQFEAFKVYEDEEKLAKIEERLKAKSTSNIYTGTEERYVTKREVAEMERQGLIPKHVIQDSPISSPMSVEKEFDDQESSFKENLQPVEKEVDDEFSMEEYSVEIYKYLREHEMSNRAKPGYMKKQPDVTASMRTILVDWLVEVAEEYKLHTETLYLAVSFVDRFLSYMSVVRAKLQLVGTAAMFLASKYEEIYPPDIGEFVYITDDTYTKRQVIRMEHLIVKVLGFDLSVPTPLSFINVMCTINRFEIKTRFLAMYLCELTMLEGETYLEFLPSELAASAIVLARYTLDYPLWTLKFAENIDYKLEQLMDCIKFLHKVYTEATDKAQHAIQDKYKTQKYHYVSTIPAPRMSGFPSPDLFKKKEDGCS